ncbi:hypothetical protein GDO78_008251 [Eleutherodactylus coqui]|uniref:Uncharacterized protein n=1 Tax=Eleutherodactylus coqui TaxID=57060 RepID=A0A8J6K9R8_ELECQ|nr:hypothetical protein GDO78_008251 [Eleutherodactylus coqui]
MDFKILAILVLKPFYKRHYKCYSKDTIYNGFPSNSPSDTIYFFFFPNILIVLMFDIETYILSCKSFCVPVIIYNKQYYVSLRQEFCPI